MGGNSTRRLTDVGIATQKNYDSFWTFKSDWTNSTITITHNLDSYLHGLDIEFLMSTDGTDGNAKKFMISDYSENVAGTRIGFQIENPTKNSFDIKIANSGIVAHIEPDGSMNFITSDYYYRIIIRRKEAKITQTYIGMVPTGTILPFGGNNIPEGWKLCDGTEYNRNEYEQLYNVIGTLWGAGNGSTTFNLPDLRGLFLRGAGENNSGILKENTNRYDGGVAGNYNNDKLLSHTHNTNVPTINSRVQLGLDNGVSYGISGGEYVSDGVNSTRSSDEVAPASGSVNYIIKT